MSFLYWLESIRCPFLDAVMQAFTCFGEELAFLLLALTIFWCVSKEEGYYLPVSYTHLTLPTKRIV